MVVWFAVLIWLNTSSYQDITPSHQAARSKEVAQEAPTRPTGTHVQSRSRLPRWTLFLRWWASTLCERARSDPGKTARDWQEITCIPSLPPSTRTRRLGTAYAVWFVTQKKHRSPRVLAYAQDRRHSALLCDDAAQAGPCRGSSHRARPITRIDSVSRAWSGG